MDVIVGLRSAGSGPPALPHAAPAPDWWDDPTALAKRLRSAPGTVAWVLIANDLPDAPRVASTLREAF